MHFDDLFNSAVYLHPFPVLMKEHDRPFQKLLHQDMTYVHFCKETGLIIRIQCIYHNNDLKHVLALRRKRKCAWSPTSLEEALKELAEGLRGAQCIGAVLTEMQPSAIVTRRYELKAANEAFVRLGSF